MKQVAQMVRLVGVEWEDLGLIPGPSFSLFSYSLHVDSLHYLPKRLSCATTIQPLDASPTRSSARNKEGPWYTIRKWQYRIKRREWAE